MEHKLTSPPQMNMFNPAMFGQFQLGQAPNPAQIMAMQFSAAQNQVRFYSISKLTKF